VSFVAVAVGTSKRFCVVALVSLADSVVLILLFDVDDVIVLLVCCAEIRGRVGRQLAFV